MTIDKTDFGKLPTGEKVDKYKLSNSMISVEVINYGGIITNIKVPDDQGDLKDVVLGFNNIEGYINEHPYFGAIIGRYGNRIKNGKFNIDGMNIILRLIMENIHFMEELRGLIKLFGL